MENITVLGVPFSPFTEEEAAQYLAQRGHNRRDTFAVFTPNPLMVMEAQRSPQFASVLQSADCNLADGTGIVGAAKRQNTPLPGRATGIGTAEKLMEHLAHTGGSVYLLGGKEGVAAAAASSLSARFPGLCIAGFRHGYFSDGESAAVAEEIAAAAPDLLCVCLGSPKQETWITSHKTALRCGVAMGLGGALDVWAGRVRRAPRWVRKLHLEWLWRMLREPRRFRALPDLIRFRRRTGRK